MPKTKILNQGKLRKNKSMAALRKILNKSQTEFSAMIGVPKSTIVAIENGQIRLSEKIDTRLRMATGASLLNMVHRFGVGISYEPMPQGEVRSCYGNKAYSRDVYDNHHRQFTQSGDAVLREILPDLEQLFKDAEKPKNKVRNRLPALTLALQEWIEDARAKFHIR